MRALNNRRKGLSMGLEGLRTLWEKAMSEGEWEDKNKEVYVMTTESNDGNGKEVTEEITEVKQID